MKPTEIFDINLTNYPSIHSSIKSSYTPDNKEIISILVDSLLNLPNKAELTATLVTQLAREDNIFKQNFIKKLSETQIQNEDELICLGISLNYLEFKNDSFYQQFLQKYFSDWSDFFNFIKFSKFEINNQIDQSNKQVNLGDVNDSVLFSDKSYNEISWDILNIKEIDLKPIYQNGNNFYTILFRIIIKNTKCNPQECYNQINSFLTEENMINLVNSFDKIQVEELHLIFLLAEIKGFLKLFLQNCPDKKVLCFIFEKFYNKEGSRTSEIEEIFLFRRQIDEEAWKYLTTLSVKEDLEDFFETTLKEECVNLDSEDFFDSLKNKEIVKNKTFFDEFCVNSSQSVSHFLINVERFSYLFDLNEEEQFYFAESLLNNFKNKFYFLEIISQKMIKFNIISEDIYKRVLKGNY